MLQVAENLEPAGGEIAGSYDEHLGWTSMPVDPTTLQLRIFLGDPVSGPLVWLFNGAPLDPEARAVREGHLRQPGVGRHLHRTPTFRIAVGEQPRQMLLNNSWYGSGEYFLLDANKLYTDPTGMDGFRTLLVFADRRGMHPVRNDHTAGMSSEELIAHNVEKFSPFREGLKSQHTSDEEAISGIALTSEDLGPARGSLDDRSAWSALSDGSLIAAAFMGDASGPVVIMSENAPNALETPQARCGADMLRVLARGSCSIGDRVLDAGSFVATQAGAMMGPVRHGPEGSTQILVFSDRRSWRPVDETGAPLTTPRIDEIQRIMAPYLG
jgi:hypothetical protein